MPRAEARQGPSVVSPAIRAWLGLIAVVAVGTACAGGGPLGMFGGSSEREGAKAASTLKYDQWRKDVLDCAGGHCENVYEVIAGRSGTLSAQVFAPYGSSHAPDFELVLLDRKGKPISRPTEPYARPRKLISPVEPGTYFLRVASRGKNQSRFRYDFVARFSAKKSKKQPVRSKPKVVGRLKQTGSSPPIVVEVANPTKQAAPFAADGAPVVTAEVLDVEDVGGVPAFVLLDAGGADVSLGMRGRLMDAGEAIGEIVIIEVFPDGSRAELRGAPTGDFSIDTVADIYDQ